MEIVIESDPYRPSSTSPAPTYLRSPVSAGQPPISSNSAFYYATLPRGGPGRGSSGGLSPANLPTDTPDGAPTTSAVRRVDKSGLLEIADLEPPGSRPGPATRLLAGAEGHGTLSRRLERSGLLEAVPELPDQHHQCHRPGLASDELLAAAATARSMVERQQHLLGAETGALEAALLRRRTFAASKGPQDGCQSSHPSQSTETETGGPASVRRVKFAGDEVLLGPEESAKQTPGRLSPRQRERQPPLSNIPDVIEAHGSSGAPAPTGSTPTSATSGGTETPRGERAEAEGCEHTVVEGVEEARVAAHKSSGAAQTNSAGKMGHNDNIQAVHVIILSEQL